MGLFADAVAKPEGPAAPPVTLEATEKWDAEARAPYEPYERSAVQREVARLDACAKGEADLWDVTTHGVTCNLLDLAHSPWTALTVAEAEQLVRDHAPRDAGFTDKTVEDKIRSAHKTVSGNGRATPVLTAGVDPFGKTPTTATVDADADAASTGPAPLPGGSWGAVDLADTVAGVLAGTITRASPTVGRLENGRALFYRKRVNGVAGHSNAGKSWTAFLSALQELEAGEHVVYIDLEDDMAAAVMRLTDLGADPDAILERFHYVSPDEAYTAEAERALHELLDAVRPTLVVIDSTGEALAVDGAKPNEDDEVARWFRRLPTTVARKSGAAVLVLDHVTKSDDGDGLWPIGSQRKRGAITGAQYMQANVKPFSRDTAGRSKLVCAKDRGGNYAERSVVAFLEVTPTDSSLDLNLSAPTVPIGSDPEVQERRKQSEMAGIMRQVVDEVAVHPGLSTSALEKAVHGQADKVRRAIRRLVEDQHLTVERGARSAHLHHPGPKPFALDARVLPMVVSATASASGDGVAS